RRAFVFPIVVASGVAALHMTLGRQWGMPAFVSHDAATPGVLGAILRAFSNAAPVITVTLAAFNVAVILQEFFFGIRARRSASDLRGEKESAFVSLVRLIAKNRRRYGGYVVHLGITAMYLGFVGTVWSTTDEVSVAPNESFNAAGYRVTYVGPRMCPGNPACSREEQSDTSKRMLFADLDVFKGSQRVTRLSPAKFIYQRGEGMTTTEVALLRGLSADLYVVLGAADPVSKRAQLQVHANPFVSWIWIGVLVLIFGASISLWPEVVLSRLGAWGIARAGAGVTASVLLAVMMASSLTPIHERRTAPLRELRIEKSHSGIGQLGSNDGNRDAP
ncbi:MAG TPA: cytochrome c-type biogenesis CcmF C-terminal domain-containing protein, partial [Polyangiaceae bacterium]